MIKENISKIKQRIERAAEKSGQNIEDIRIVCVTKYAQVTHIQEVIQEGILDLGENRLQEAFEKIEALKEYSLRWHLVGHLQSNKVKKAVRNFELIHSLDSLKLALLIDKEAAKINKIQRVLIQVNTQGQGGTFGLLEEEVQPLLEKIKSLNSLEVYGLMTIAPLAQTSEESRSYFRKLRELKIRLEKEVEGIKLPILSMGMSQDFEVAVEEGANMLRIGRAIFEGS